MKKKLFSTFFICLMLQSLLLNFSLEAAKKKQPFTCQEEADVYLNKHYALGCRDYNQENWKSAADSFEKVVHFFPTTEQAAASSFYLGVCYYEMREYDFANTAFSNYLKVSTHPVFFEEAVQYKFCIAERLKNGKKRRPFTFRYLPKCLNGEDLALTIYDEVVAALPNHELTIQALHSKAALLRKMREYRLCVETYQILIRRFPANSTVPVCYVEIANAYIEQSHYEFQNPDILALAQLNAKKFAEDFPRDENLTYVNESVMKIKESYAKGLCNLGLFYERTDHPEAAIIYYQSAIEEFPDTHVAEFSRSRMIMLREQLNQLEEIKELNREILIHEGLLEENVCSDAAGGDVDGGCGGERRL